MCIKQLCLKVSILSMTFTIKLWMTVLSKICTDIHYFKRKEDIYNDDATLKSTMLQYRVSQGQKVIKSFRKIWVTLYICK